MDRQQARSVVLRGARAICSPAGVRGTAIEATWLAAHLVTYPFGFTQEKARPRQELFSMQGLPLIQRSLLHGNVTAAGTPILLVHGLVDNRSIFTLLCRSLRRRGFGQVATYNYRPWTSDLRAAAAKLGEQVEAICEQTGYERIHVVGHSMGGIIARYYAQRLGGDSRIHTLVTLGSPHGGTGAARLVPFGVTAQLAPSSAVIEELRQPAPGCRTRFLAFWSDLDGLITPKQAARIEHPDLAARNVFVRGVGHMSLPIDRRVVHQIVTTLAHLETDGSTAAVGVTPIASTSDRPEPDAVVTALPEQSAPDAVAAAGSTGAGSNERLHTSVRRV